MACEVIAAQNVFALQFLPHRVDSAQRQFFETRRKSNFDLLNVIFGIGLGTLLQNYGRNLNADVLSTADLFESVGSNLVSVSFAIPRVARVRPVRPDCDLGNRRIFQAKRDLRFQIEEACQCPETRLDTFRKLKSLHELQISAQCSGQESTLEQKLLTETIGLAQKSLLRQ
ncbi:uncharacterized protein LOC131877737 isoform X1 [Tigriopus californicus]|nr:uncharacterized protein LOC131877737 isoform X1 [Tigriopus californicus]